MTVYIALIMLLLISFFSLAADVGHLYLVKSQLQNAADAGALAGVGVTSSKDPTAEVKNLVNANKPDGNVIEPDIQCRKMDNSIVSCSIFNEVKTIRVTVNLPVQIWFAKVFSNPLDPVTLRATATAELSQSGNPHLIR